mgnify:CR=1 FL=1
MLPWWFPWVHIKGNQMNMSNCYQIIKSVGEGIAVTSGARRITKGMCDLHYQIIIQKSVCLASNPALTRLCHK